MELSAVTREATCPTARENTAIVLVKQKQVG